MGKPSEQYPYVVLCALAGGVLFALLSLPVRFMVGGNSFMPISFLSPIIVGCASGFLLGRAFYRIKSLNRKLQNRVNTLEKILPICSECKKIRLPDSDPNDRKSWVQMEVYISERTGSAFSHGLCPDCHDRLIKELN